MQQQTARHDFFFIMNNLHCRAIGVGPRILLSVMAAVLFAGLAAWGACVWEHCSWGYAFGDHRHDGWVSGDDILRAWTIAVFPWLLSLCFIWQGYFYRRRVSARVVAVAFGICLGAIAMGLIVSRLVGGHLAGAITLGLLLVAAALVLSLWLPLMVRGRIHRASDDAEDGADAVCPACGQLPDGANAWQCPECAFLLALNEGGRPQACRATIKRVDSVSPRPETE